MIRCTGPQIGENLPSRTTLGPEISRENLSVMAIESNLVRSFDFASVINRFASSKARKAKL